MPYCPVCRLEYRPGFTECSDCHAELVDELPPEPGLPRAASTTDIVVARVHGQAMAEMWVELLGNQGIASRLNPLSRVADTVYPTDTLYELLVPAIDAPRARDVLPLTPEDRPSPPSEEEVFDEVDDAIAEGNLERADDLLDSLEEGDGRGQASN
jgi:hypothetical protein